MWVMHQPPFKLMISIANLIMKPVNSGHPLGPKPIGCNKAGWIIQCSFYIITALWTKELGCIREVALKHRLSVWLH